MKIWAATLGSWLVLVFWLTACDVGQATLRGPGESAWPDEPGALPTEVDAGPDPADSGTGSEADSGGAAVDGGVAVTDSGSAEMNPECLGSDCGPPIETGGCYSGVSCFVGPSDGGATADCYLRWPAQGTSSRTYTRALVSLPKFGADRRSLVCGDLDAGSCGGLPEATFGCDHACFSPDGGVALTSTCG
jgi:hypothetical protein